MSKLKFYLFVSLLLIALSATLFWGHYLVFGQLGNTLYYSLMNICFIPINLLAVTIVFEKLLEYRDKKDRLSKTNMLVGVFFSEIGFTFLKLLVPGDAVVLNLAPDITDLKAISLAIKNHPHKLDISRIDCKKLSTLLTNQSTLLINLISNESILEHELFSDLLMAMIHLRDELLFREHKVYTQVDYAHITADLTRVYQALTLQWVHYLIHLKVAYPFLYNNALVHNPFNSSQPE